MELTGKCKEALEKWYLKDYLEIRGTLTNDYCGDKVQQFYKKRPSEKFGVLVDFFDSVGISVDTYGVVMYSFKVIMGLKPKNRHDNNPTYDTRPKARTAAIEKADEIFNNQ